jgi:hypothetical protein
MMEVLIGAGFGLIVVAFIALSVPWAMSVIDPVADTYLRYVDWVERRMGKRRVDVTTFGDAAREYETR